MRWSLRDLDRPLRLSFSLDLERPPVAIDWMAATTLMARARRRRARRADGVEGRLSFGRYGM